MLGPIPKPPFDVPGCLSVHLTSATACTVPRSQGLNATGEAAEAAAVRSAGGTYIDTDPVVLHGHHLRGHGRQSARLPRRQPPHRHLRLVSDPSDPRRAVLGARPGLSHVPGPDRFAVAGDGQTADHWRPNHRRILVAPNSDFSWTNSLEGSSKVPDGGTPGVKVTSTLATRSPPNSR